MSVINQMLKDLDARQRRVAIDPGMGSARPAARALRDGPGRIVVFGMLVLALALSLAGWWLWQRVPPVPTPAPEAVVPAPVPAPAPAPAPVPVPAPVPAPPPRIERLSTPIDPLEAVREALATGDAATALALLESDAAATGAEAIALRANALQQMGRHREAAAAYAAALERQPEVAAWWVGLGMMLEADGRPREARAAYLEATRRGPLDAALADYARARAEALAVPTPR